MRQQHAFLLWCQHQATSTPCDLQLQNDVGTVCRVPNLDHSCALPSKLREDSGPPQRTRRCNLCEVVALIFIYAAIYLLGAYFLA